MAFGYLEEAAAASAAAEETPEVAEEPKAPEELEGHAPACAKPKVKDAFAFLTQDTTLNVMQAADGTNVVWPSAAPRSLLLRH